VVDCVVCFSNIYKKNTHRILYISHVSLFRPVSLPISSVSLSVCCCFLCRSRS